MPPLGRGRCRNIVTTFGTKKKLECCMCHQAGEKMFEDIFARFDAIHERGRRTDERTLHDGIGCARHGVAQQERETTEPGA